ncbi:MAG: hypothetical protein ABSC42_15535 [Tepidisphaeraceae bacterium]
MPKFFDFTSYSLDFDTKAPKDYRGNAIRLFHEFEKKSIGADTGDEATARLPMS